jgi:acetyltransferase
MTAARSAPRPVAEPRHLRFPALDGVRGLAALAIIATHAGFASGRSLDNDLLAAFLGRFDFGVAVFFLLSGLLLYRPFVVDSILGAADPSFRSFWSRRLVRIVPALWVMLAVTLGVLTTRPSSLSDWLHYLLLIQVYDHHQVDPNLSQLWTLSAEVAFYAALPLGAALVRRRSRTPAGAVRGHLILIAALIVSALVFNVVQANLLNNTQALLWAPGYVDWFAFGMLFAVLSAAPPSLLDELPSVRRLQTTLVDWASSPLTCWTAAAVLWLLSTTQVATPRTVSLPTFWQWTIQHYLFAAAAVFIFVPFVFGTGGRTGSVFGSRAGTLLGELSYSVYLWHLPLLLLLQRSLGYTAFGGHFWSLLLLTTAATLGVAALSWFALERPLLRYGVRRRASKGIPATAASVKAETVSS